MDVMNELRFRGTPDRGWYEDLDPSKICPLIMECASESVFLRHDVSACLSIFTLVECSQNLVRLSNENSDGGE
jgi:hypothetical protein